MNELNTTKIAVTICICTFRRLHIVETLHSILQLGINPQWDVRVIVADNDETDSARQIVDSVAIGTKLPIKYIHAPARNISIARNACLDSATTPLIAFIDDDELVSTGWLKAILEKLESSNADAILGAVKAIYTEECDNWLREGDFLSTYPVWVDGKIITGYGGNVLIKLIKPELHKIRFREDLGKTGGEDTVYFSSFYKAGGIIDFAPDAIVTEVITPDRAKFSWLLKRRFRSGQTHGLLLMEQNNYINNKLKNIIKTTAKLLFCLLATLLNFFRPIKMRAWLLRGALHAGVIARLLGKRELIQYG